jgi:translation initiation factor IF-3
MAHPELGRKILDKIAADVEDIAIVEAAPRQDGRNMTMVLHPTTKRARPAPSKQKDAGTTVPGETEQTSEPAPDTSSAPTGA